MRKQSKKVKHLNDIHSNENYLNFIKKNHQRIQEQFTTLQHSPKPYQSAKSKSYSSKLDNQEKEKTLSNQMSQRNYNKKAIHDSLSKLQMGGNNINQVSQIYNFGQFNSISYDEQESQIFDHILQKNNEIAKSLMRRDSKKPKKKHEVAKELLFHLNKNRNTREKKYQFRGIQPHNRYTLEPDKVQLNLKFPSIQNKQTPKWSPSIQKLQSLKSPHSKRQQISLKQSLDSSNKQLITSKTLESKLKLRQELYGFLPTFKYQPGYEPGKPKLTFNKGKIVRSQKIKHQKNSLEEYLEQNIVMKSVKPLIGVGKERKVAIFNNRQILDISIQSNNYERNQTQNEIQIKTVQNKEKEQNPEELKQPQQTSKDQLSPAKIKQKKQPNELKYQGDLTIYELKIRSYREFIFMVNLAHGVFDSLILKDSGHFKADQKYKYYLGKGNNYLLIRSLLKRRFWWGVEDDPKKANFVWTQLKINYFYQLQMKSQVTQLWTKLDCDFQQVSPKKRRKLKNIQKNQPKTGMYRAPFPLTNDKKIFTNADKKYYDQFLEKVDNPEKMLKYQNRLKLFPENFLKNRRQDTYSQRVHNHLQYNYFIGNKKALFYNLKQYYDLQGKNVFDVIPLTYHIKKGTADPQYEAFVKEFRIRDKEKKKKNGIGKNVWIVKPGELSNRGQGITVIDEIYQLNTIFKKKQKHNNGQQKTYIVQKYLQRPLLYKNRKFDIRHYMMISRLHGKMRAYWFGEGYIRTSSYQYNIEEIGDEAIHLTNDAIQKYADTYGKYEEGNKVSYNQFQRYMDNLLGQGKFNFNEMIYPKMKNIALDSIKSTYLQLDPNNTEHNFQIFGLDFMIDLYYNVWLIEVNTNPCLELSSKILQRIIPTMLEHTLRLTLDVIYPPPAHFINSQKYLAPDNPLERLQFELIFDQDRDGKQIVELYRDAKKVDMGDVDEDDQVYQNDGKQIQLDGELQ